MCIDNAIKYFNRHLTQIADLKKTDLEDAFLMHSAANEDFQDIVNLIRAKYEQLQTLLGAQEEEADKSIAAV